MDGLIKTLPTILAAAGASLEVTEAVCKVAWKHAVGDTLSVHVRPVRLEAATLVIAVADHIWQKQLEAMRPQLLFRLNAVLGVPLVKLIEIRIDSEAFMVESTPPASAKPAPSSIPFEVLAAASEIEDAGLRRAFLGAATSCIQRLEKQ